MENTSHGPATPTDVVGKRFRIDLTSLYGSLGVSPLPVTDAVDPCTPVARGPSSCASRDQLANVDRALPSPRACQTFRRVCSGAAADDGVLEQHNRTPNAPLAPVSVEGVGLSVLSHTTDMAAGNAHDHCHPAFGKTACDAPPFPFIGSGDGEFGSFPHTARRRLRSPQVCSINRQSGSISFDSFTIPVSADSSPLTRANSFVAKGTDTEGHRPVSVHQEASISLPLQGRAAGRSGSSKKPRLGSPAHSSHADFSDMSHARIHESLSGIARSQDAITLPCVNEFNRRCYASLPLERVTGLYLLTSRRSDWAVREGASTPNEQPSLDPRSLICASLPVELTESFSSPQMRRSPVSCCFDTPSISTIASRENASTGSFCSSRIVSPMALPLCEPLSGVSTPCQRTPQRSRCGTRTTSRTTIGYTVCSTRSAHYRGNNYLSASSTDHHRTFPSTYSAHPKSTRRYNCIWSASVPFTSRVHNLSIESTGGLPHPTFNHASFMSRGSGSAGAPLVDYLAPSRNPFSPFRRSLSAMVEGGGEGRKQSRLRCDAALVVYNHTLPPGASSLDRGMQDSGWSGGGPERSVLPTGGTRMSPFQLPRARQGSLSTDVGGDKCLTAEKISPQLQGSGASGSVNGKVRDTPFTATVDGAHEEFPLLLPNSKFTSAYRFMSLSRQDTDAVSTGCELFPVVPTSPVYHSARPSRTAHPIPTVATDQGSVVNTRHPISGVMYAWEGGTGDTTPVTPELGSMSANRKSSPIPQTVVKCEEWVPCAERLLQWNRYHTSYTPVSASLTTCPPITASNTVVWASERGGDKPYQKEECKPSPSIVDVRDQGTTGMPFQCTVCPRYELPHFAEVVTNPVITSASLQRDATSRSQLHEESVVSSRDGIPSTRRPAAASFPSPTGLDCSWGSGDEFGKVCSHRVADCPTLHVVPSELQDASLGGLVSAADEWGLDDTSRTIEDEPGDRFLQHHRYQFMHRVPPTMGSESFFLPLHVDVNGVVWLATHRTDGMPYAVKEIPVRASESLPADLACATLANAPSGDIQQQASAYLCRYYTCSRYEQCTVPPPSIATGVENAIRVLPDQEDPVIDHWPAHQYAYLLQMEYFPEGCVWEWALDPFAVRGDPYTLPKEAQWRCLLEHGLRALEALHAHELVHGNPLPVNLFVRGEAHFKLGNFGSAVHRPQRYPDTVPSWIRPPFGANPYETDVHVFCRSVAALYRLCWRKAFGSADTVSSHAICSEAELSAVCNIAEEVDVAVGSDAFMVLLRTMSGQAMSASIALSLLQAGTLADFLVCQLYDREIRRLQAEYDRLLEPLQDRGVMPWQTPLAGNSPPPIMKCATPVTESIGGVREMTPLFSTSRDASGSQTSPLALTHSTMSIDSRQQQGMLAASKETCTGDDHVASSAIIVRGVTNSSGLQTLPYTRGNITCDTPAPETQFVYSKSSLLGEVRHRSQQCIERLVNTTIDRDSTSDEKTPSNTPERSRKFLSQVTWPMRQSMAMMAWSAVEDGIPRQASPRPKMENCNGDGGSRDGFPLPRFLRRMRNVHVKAVRPLTSWE